MVRTRSKTSHQAILTAAKNVLQQRGYQGFTIEEVAQQAKSSKQTIYRWWPNKARLVAEVYEQESSLELTLSDHVSTQERYRQLLRDLWSLWKNTVCGEAFCCFIAEAQLNEDNLNFMLDQFMIRRAQLPRQILEEGIARGDLSSSTDVDLILRMSFGFCWFQLLTKNIDNFSLLDSFVDQLFAGLE